MKNGERLNHVKLVETFIETIFTSIIVDYGNSFSIAAYTCKATKFAILYNFFRQSGYFHFKKFYFTEFFNLFVAIKHFQTNSNPIHKHQTFFFLFEPNHNLRLPSQFVHCAILYVNITVFKKINTSNPTIISSSTRRLLCCTSSY